MSIFDNTHNTFSGTGAQIASLLPYINELAYCTSTGSGFTSGTLYIYISTGWTAIGGGGGVTSVTAADSSVTVSPTTGLVTVEVAAGGVSAAKLGTVTDGVTTDQSGAGSTIEVKAIDASKITSGTMATARLGSGATTSNFLRGDQTYATPTGGGY